MVPRTLVLILLACGLILGACGGGGAPLVGAEGPEDVPDPGGDSGDGDGDGDTPPPCEEDPPSTGLTVFHLGHSLVNSVMPRMFEDAADAAALTHTSTIDTFLSTTTGSDLGPNLERAWLGWPHPSFDWDPLTYWRNDIPTGLYDVVVVTEGVGEGGLSNYSADLANTRTYAGEFYSYALSHNSDTQFYVYSTWGNIPGWGSVPDFASWRGDLEYDEGSWEGIVDGVNSDCAGLIADGAKPVLLVPGDKAMRRLSLEVATVPGIISMADFFADAIHLNGIGNYFIAMVHYATIYKRSPVGLTENVRGGEWNGVPLPSAETARRLQAIAWDAVVSDPYSGAGQGSGNCPEDG